MAYKKRLCVATFCNHYLVQLGTTGKVSKVLSVRKHNVQPLIVLKLHLVEMGGVQLSDNSESQTSTHMLIVQNIVMLVI